MGVSILGLIVILFFVVLLGVGVAIITALWTRVRVLEKRLLQVEAYLALQVENEAD
jgi:hypothetical protein